MGRRTRFPGRATEGRVKVQNLIVRTKTLTVYVTDDGRFEADFNDHTFSAPTRDGLYDKLMQATKSAGLRLDIPVVIGPPGYGWDAEKDDDTRIGRGFIRGIHAGNENILVERNGKTSQHSAYSDGALFTSMTDAEIDEFKLLLAAQRKATQALKAFEKKWKIADPKRLVLAEIEKRSQSEKA